MTSEGEEREREKIDSRYIYTKHLESFHLTAFIRSLIPVLILLTLVLKRLMISWMNLRGTAHSLLMTSRKDRQRILNRTRLIEALHSLHSLRLLLLLLGMLWMHLWMRRW